MGCKRSFSVFVPLARGAGALTEAPLRLPRAVNGPSCRWERVSLARLFITLLRCICRLPPREPVRDLRAAPARRSWPRAPPGARPELAATVGVGWRGLSRRLRLRGGGQRALPPPPRPSDLGRPRPPLPLPLRASGRAAGGGPGPLAQRPHPPWASRPPPRCPAAPLSSGFLLAPSPVRFASMMTPPAPSLWPVLADPTCAVGACTPLRHTVTRRQPGAPDPASCAGLPVRPLPPAPPWPVPAVWGSAAPSASHTPPQPGPAPSPAPPSGRPVGPGRRACSAQKRRRPVSWAAALTPDQPNFVYTATSLCLGNAKFFPLKLSLDYMVPLALAADGRFELLDPAWPVSLCTDVLIHRRT